MVKPLPRKQYRKDIDPLDNLQFDEIRINPEPITDRGNKFGDRTMQVALCQRCSKRINFYGLGEDPSKEEIQADRVFVRNSLIGHMREVHPDAGNNFDFYQEFLLEGVEV